MMSKKELCSLYSVFVGHLSLSVTETDLLELFSGCGKVEDVFICENNTLSQYLFGFVRYRDIESVYKAVKTLHRWPLKGNKIVVDIAKDTGDRIKKGGDTFINVNKLLSTPSPSAPLVKEHPPSVASSNIIQDVMHLGRLKECYASLSMEAKYHVGSFADQKTVSITDMETFIEDVEQSVGGKSAPYEGKIKKNVSPESVNQALLNSDDLDPAFGMNRANQFMSSLKVVIGNMASFLKDHELMSTETAEIVNLCSEEKEENYSSGSGHSSVEDSKDYRDLALEERLRQPESPDSEVYPVYKCISSSTHKKNSDESAGNTSRSSEPELFHSNQGKCLSFEPQEFADYQMYECSVKVSDDKACNEIEEVEESVTKEHEKCQDDEILSNDENSEEFEEVFSSVNFKLEMEDHILKDKKSETNTSKSLSIIEAQITHLNSSESGEDLKLSSTSSLSSHSTTSESIKLSKSNYYRPKSPVHVSPDTSIISSALHSKTPQAILTTKPISKQQTKVNAFVHSQSSPCTGASFIKTSPTAISSSLKKLPSPPRLSLALHSNSPSISTSKSFSELPRNTSAPAHLKSSPTLRASYPNTSTSILSSLHKVSSPPFSSHAHHSKSPLMSRDSVHGLNSSPREMPADHETKTFNKPALCYKIGENDAKKLDDKDSHETDKVSKAQPKEHEKFAEDEIMLEKGNSGEIEGDLNSKTFKLEIKDDDVLREKVSEITESEIPPVSAISATDQDDSEDGDLEDLKSSSANSLSSHSSMNAKLSRSNYYRPFSPISTDVSVTSSDLHSTTLDTSTSVAMLEPPTDVKGFRQSDATSHPESSQPDTSSTVIPVSSMEMPSPPGLSFAHHTKSSSSISDSVYSLPSSPTEIPVKCETDTIHTPTQHEKFHENIPDSEAMNFHKSKQCQRLEPNIPDNEDQASPFKCVTSPKFEETQKLDLGQLFGLCNGQKQEVEAEKVSLSQIFSMCNGQKQKLSCHTEICLQTTRESQGKRNPKGVQQEEFQKYLELVKLGRGRGCSSLVKTTR